MRRIPLYFTATLLAVVGTISAENPVRTVGSRKSEFGNSKKHAKKTPVAAVHDASVIHVGEIKAPYYSETLPENPGYNREFGS
jgi:hypothetical protein